MNYYKNGKRNGFNYNNKSAKQNIEKNKFVKKVRKKLMEERLKLRLNN